MATVLPVRPWVVAPSGPVGDTAQRRARVRRALWRLALQGIEPTIAPDVWRKDGYLAGPDPARVRALVEALNADHAFVWAARGGYGAMRLLPALDHLLKVRDKAPLFLGFSDLTAVFPLLVRKGFRCVHGPVLSQVSDLVESGPAGFTSLTKVLKSHPIPPLTFSTPDPWFGDEIEGPLWGGNLTLCAALCGTPYSPDYSGAILFLEDVGEPAYRLDRMLTQLELSGVLQAVQAVLVGDPGVRGSEKKAVEQRLHLIRERWGIPVLTGLPIGHQRRNACLEVGRTVKLSATPLKAGKTNITIRWV